MKKNILILEDESVLANIYKKNLEAAGFDVKCALTVDQASKLLDKYQPDLALIDHGITGEEEAGLDFVPKLKKTWTGIPHFRSKKDSGLQLIGI